MAKRTSRSVKLTAGTGSIKEKKGLGIFDYLNNLTENKVDWESYSDAEKKGYTPYMINRWLSMNMEYTELANELQKFNLDKKEHYKIYLGMLPKEKKFTKYIKSKTEDKYNPELIEYLCKYFEIGSKDIIDNLNIYYKTEEGINEVKTILQKYGIEEKKIKKLMSF